MKLDEARQVVTDGVLHIDPNNTFDDQKIDRAISFAASLFANETKCCITQTNFAITAATAAVTFTADSSSAEVVGFQPAFIEHLRIGYADVQRVDYDYVRRRLEADSTAAKPTTIAFETYTSALVYPVPDANYTLVATWAAPFNTSWSLGTKAEVTLNIPDRLIRPMLWYGAAAALVYGQMGGNPWPSTGWKLFLEYIEWCKKNSGLNDNLTAPHPYMAQQMGEGSPRGRSASQGQ